MSVTPTTDEPGRRFAQGSVLLLDDGPRTIAASRLTGPRIAIQLEGCSDRGQAESLRGQWLYVDLPEDEQPVQPEEFYDHQLAGLDVRVDGRSVGVVAEVLHLPGQDVLAVELGSGRQVLVPFVEQIVPVVDLAAGLIDVVAVEGLFDDAN